MLPKLRTVTSHPSSDVALHAAPLRPSGLYEAERAESPDAENDVTIESLFLPLLFSYAERKGANARAVAFEAGVPFAVLGTIPVRLDAIESITNRIGELLDEPHYALALADGAARGLWGVGELVARFADTVEQAMIRVDRYARLIPPFQRIAWSRSGGQVRCSFYVVGGMPPLGGRHWNEFSVARLFRFVKELCGVELKATTIWFAHPAPADTSALESYFGTTQIIFDAQENGFALDEHAGDLPVSSADAATSRVLVEYADSLLPASDSVDPLEARVQGAVARALPDGAPTLVIVAKALGMGTRTLQRRLLERHLSFMDLVEGVRKNLALSHLRNPAYSVSEVAFLLGYADGRAFARAFARWTGAPPLVWRRDERRRASPGCPSVAE